MSECEICGHMASFKAEIESAVVDVCERCSRLGRVIVEKAEPAPARIAVEKPPAELVLDPDFPKLIKEAREKKNLTRQQLAEKIKEKEAVLERIENGMRPTESIAKKLEKEIGVNLGYVEAVPKISPLKTKELTVGDVVEVRVRKRK